MSFHLYNFESIHWRLLALLEFLYMYMNMYMQLSFFCTLQHVLPYGSSPSSAYNNLSRFLDSFRQAPVS